VICCSKFNFPGTTFAKQVLNDLQVFVLMIKLILRKSHLNSFCHLFDWHVKSPHWIQISRLLSMINLLFIIS